MTASRLKYKVLDGADRFDQYVLDVWRVFADLYYMTACRVKYKVLDVADRFDQNVLDLWRVFADLY